MNGASPSALVYRVLMDDGCELHRLAFSRVVEVSRVGKAARVRETADIVIASDEAIALVTT